MTTDRIELGNGAMEAIVIETFQRYLRTSEELPLSLQLLDDLGMDSLTFVTILLELADQLALDLRSAEIDPGSIHTLADVVSLVGRLSPAH